MPGGWPADLESIEIQAVGYNLWESKGSVRKRWKGQNCCLLACWGVSQGSRSCVLASQVPRHAAAAEARRRTARVAAQLGGGNGDLGSAWGAECSSAESIGPAGSWVLTYLLASASMSN